MRIFALLLLLANTFGCSAGEVKNLPVELFEQGMVQPGAQLLDVRTMNEFNKGYLPNAMHADWTIRHQFEERVKALDKSKPVYVYCLSGARSSAAVSWLQQNGFTAYNLAGGIAAWKKAGKEVMGAKMVPQMPLEEYAAMVKKHETLLVDIGATWCPPCKKMNPIVDSIAAIHSEKMTLLKIDGGEQTSLAGQLQVEAFPTFIIYKNGKEVWRRQGLVDPAEIVKQL